MNFKELKQKAMVVAIRLGLGLGLVFLGLAIMAFLKVRIDFPAYSLMKSTFVWTIEGFGYYQIGKLIHDRFKKHEQ